MCMGGTPKAPAPPPPPPEPPEAPKMVDADVQQARTDERLNARRAAGRSGTIKTDSDLATEQPNTANRTLLG
jgi:hypothetical protein